MHECDTSIIGFTWLVIPTTDVQRMWTYNYCGGGTDVGEVCLLGRWQNNSGPCEWNWLVTTERLSSERSPLCSSLCRLASGRDRCLGGCTPPPATVTPWEIKKKIAIAGPVRTYMVAWNIPGGCHRDYRTRRS